MILPRGWKPCCKPIPSLVRSRQGQGRFHCAARSRDLKAWPRSSCPSRSRRRALHRSGTGWSISFEPLTPENYLAAGEEAWRLAGLSRAKQATLARISEAIIAGDLDLHGLCDQPIDEAMAAMTSVKGIGPWTAEVYLLFSAGHADVFPSGDVALQHAYAHAFAESARPDSKALALFAERWSPWRGVAARLFWAYYAATRGRDGTPIT